MIPGYEGSRVLIGPPGVGKTRYLADRIPRLIELSGRRPTEDDCPVVICSHTNAAAYEVADRVPDLPASAMRTLHSLCYRAIQSPPITDHDRVKLEWNSLYPALALTPPKKRRGLPDDIVQARRDEMPGDEVAQLYNTLRHRLVPFDRMPPRVQEFAALWEAWKREAGLVDFVDMLALAPAEPPLGADMVVCDEVQDFSALAWRVVWTWGGAAGSVLVVGDPYQALYDPWAGADASLLLEHYHRADEQAVLTHSYRVPATVHALAMRWVRRLSIYEPIEYSPRRLDANDRTSPVVQGSVVRCRATWTEPEAAVDEAAQLAEQGMSVLFIFSANYMAQPLCDALRTRRLVFDNPWRKDERAWNPLRSPGAMSFLGLLEPGRRWTPGGIADWTEPLATKGLLRRGAKAALRQLGGAHRTLAREDVERWFEPGPLEELRRVVARGNGEEILHWWCERLLPSRREECEYAAAVYRMHGIEPFNQSALLHPSTAHAAKGAAADHVFVFPDLSVAACDAWDDGGLRRDPVIRAFYVAVTRTYECLHLCEPAGRRFVEL